MLQNETYTGRTVYKRTRVEAVHDYNTGKKKRRVVSLAEADWIDVPGATPPLVSQDTFNRAQTIFNDPDRRLRGQPSRRYRLRGHLRCLTCGTPMVGHAQAGGRYRYYRCRRTYAGYFEGQCDSKYVGVDLLEHTVLEQIAELLSDPLRITEEAKRLKGGGHDSVRLETVNRELQQVEERQRRLAKLYVEGSIPEEILSAESEQSSSNRRRTSLESERRALVPSTPRVMDLGQLNQMLPKVTARLRSWVMEASKENMELILRALEVQVRASCEKIQIEGTVPVLESEPEDLVTIVQTSA